MFGSYLKIAWRSQIRNRTFSLINILGLTIGLACSLLILLWVQHEKSIDNFHDKGDRLYLLYERQFMDNKVYAAYGTEGVLANELKRIVPEIEYASNFAWISDSPDRLTFEFNDKLIKFDGCYADTDYFKMMSYPLLKGNAATALNTPLSMCISHTMAKAFFGSAAAAIGQTLRYENKKDLTVTAVFEDLPENVSAKFDFLINWTEFLAENKWANDWGNIGVNTLVLLRKDANPQLVENKIKNFLDKYKGRSANFRAELGIQHFGDSYLHGTFKDGFIAGGRITYVKLFILIAVFILLIACINFMNLTTARSSKRAKEIGVRKVTGAGRTALIRQFIGEAMIVTLVSVLLALILVLVTLPFFNQLIEKDISFPYSDSYFWIGLLVLTLITGLASGSYPAIFLSSFKPIVVLKGRLQFGKGSIGFRKGLVIFQFTLSIVLIIGTMVVSKQVNYIQHTNLGYNREDFLYVPLEGDFVDKFEVFKQEALRSSGIKNVSWIGESPTAIGSSTWGVEWEGKTPNTVTMFTNSSIGYDFVKTMNLKLIAGRDFSKNFSSDSLGYLINEAALKILNFNDPIGKNLTFWGKKGRIIGVLKDFHFSSLHDPIKPLILRNGEGDRWGNILIRTEAGRTEEALESLERIVKVLNPKVPFTYSFADDAYQKLYQGEELVNKLSSCFAFLGIFVSCLGLFGLALFTAEQRTKEIGIRKVLGANITSLFTLLSKEFVVLIVVSVIIALPLAWWIMSSWLQDFAYRTDISWQVFALATLLILIIAVVTISYQTIKAVLTNPIESLREE